MRLRAAAVVGLTLLAGFSAAPAFAQHAQYYVLDAFGGVHAGGGAPTINPAPPYFGFDLLVDFTIVEGDGLLVLDRFGGVYPGGTLVANPPIGGTPYFGFDVARAIVHREAPTATSATIYRAGVNGGTLSPSSVGVTGVRSLGGGKTNVVFAQDISACQRVAAIGEVSGFLPSSYDGLSGEAYSYLAAGPNQGRELIVVTRNGSGVPADLPFFVVVFC